MLSSTRVSTQSANSLCVDTYSELHTERRVIVTLTSRSLHVHIHVSRLAGQRHASFAHNNNNAHTPAHKFNHPNHIQFVNLSTPTTTFPTTKHLQQHTNHHNINIIIFLQPNTYKQSHLPSTKTTTFSTWMYTMIKDFYEIA